MTYQISSSLNNKYLDCVNFNAHFEVLNNSDCVDWIDAIFLLTKTFNIPDDLAFKIAIEWVNKREEG
mgnify:FL=1